MLPFYFVKYIIKANTSKLKRWPIGNIINSNEAWMFTVFESWFQYRSTTLIAKGVTSSNSGIFICLIAFEKEIFKISVILASCVKILVSSLRMILFWRLCLIRNERFHRSRKLFIIHNISLIYISLVITFCFS